MSLHSFYVHLFGCDVQYAFAECLATITKVTRYVDQKSWAKHECLVFFAQSGSMKFCVRIDRTRNIGNTNHLKLSWDAADTVSTCTELVGLARS